MISRALAALALVALFPGAALAHQSSFAYGELVIDGTDVSFKLKLSAGDLSEALGLPADSTASDAEIRAGADRLMRYAEERIDLDFGDAACERSRSPVAIQKSQARYAVLSWRYRCDAEPRKVVLDYVLFQDLDPRHVCFLKLAGGLVQLRYPDDNRLIYEPGRGVPGRALAMVVSGIEHILIGLDHVLFLVVILIAVPLRRTSEGIDKRGRWDALRQTAFIVTSFTIAHSVTLVLASLGHLQLGARFVESVIALSIVYVAIENVLRPGAAHRAAVVFAFGLVHGLGFASILRELLPASGLAVPLIAFNVGVELGQLLIVAVGLPLVLALASRLGPGRYQRGLVPVATLAVATLGVIWLFERALEVELIGL